MNHQDAVHILDQMKANARDVVTYHTIVPELLILRCTWVPDMSYGRYHEPPAGNEEFQWAWAPRAPWFPWCHCRPF